MRISSLSLAVLATSVTAVPHRRHPHPHAVRRDADVVTTYITETDRAVMYVDQNGNPVRTSVEPVDSPAPTDGTIDPGSSSSDVNFEQPSAQNTVAPPSSSVSSPNTSSAPLPQSSSSLSEEYDGEVAGYSIAYAPYNGDHSCKTEAQVNSDIDGLSEYDLVRIYGTDCDQVRLIMAAAKRNNMRVFAGIWDINDAASEAQLIVDAAKDDWTRIHTISVGNEVLSNGASLESLIGGIDAARSVLEGAGYDGPITTVEVYSKLWESQYQPLCSAIDVVAANCHPYFDANETPENAGNYVREAAQRLTTDFCDKDVVITESGWPSKGMTNGNAVPSLQNQQTAVRALRTSYSDAKEKLILFSAYDDDWKTDNEYGVEHYWGIHGVAPSAKK